MVFAPRTGSKTVEATLKTAHGKLIRSRSLPPFHSDCAATGVRHPRPDERLETKPELPIMAHHDALTDLPNRVLLAERLHQALVVPAKGRSPCCAWISTASRGQRRTRHTVGDTLLKAVAGRLRSCVRETDTIARMGGDEFVILQCRAAQR